MEEKSRIDQIKQELMQEKMDKVANIKHEPKNTTYSNKADISDKINHLYLTPLNWNKNDWASVIQRYIVFFRAHILFHFFLTFMI